MSITFDVVDYCAGIGGWEVALLRRGRIGHGIENAKYPRQARELNGLETVWDDLTTVPESLLARGCRGVVGSFPCQPFSQNIKGLSWREIMLDPRARLMLIGFEHLKALLPEFVCLENVSKAGRLMEVLAEGLRDLGYSAEVRVVNAADFGLPQARKRALLVARRDGRPIEWPEATHAPLSDHKAMILGRKPWVTLSDAVGRTFEGAQEWGNRLPSPAVVGSFRPEMHAPPRYRGYGDVSRQNDPGAIELSLDERLMLQGFPPGWRLAGPKSAMDLQVGNAIPPILAEVALDAAGVARSEAAA